jgi:IS30 family transposase
MTCRRLQCRASEADQNAWESALRSKRCLVALRVKLQEIVAGKLLLAWSPKQISGWLKSQNPEDERMRVSRETIYRSLFIQARGVLKKDQAADTPLAARTAVFPIIVTGAAHARPTRHDERTFRLKD